MVLMRKEAALQGLTGVKVWDCGVGCYDEEQFIKAGGADVEGQYVDTLFLPFYSKADQKANPMLGNVREVHRARTTSPASARTRGRRASPSATR